MGYLTRTRWPGMMLAFAVIAALAFSAGSIASVGGQEETTFYACALRNGDLHQISIEEPDCPRSMTLVSWDQTGPIGPPGEKGDQGDPGVQGMPGADGQDGTDGVDGTDGDDGQDGAPGADGVDGRDGARGADGVDGRDGAPGVDGQDGQNGLGVASGTCSSGSFMVGIGDDGSLICKYVPEPILNLSLSPGFFRCNVIIEGLNFAPNVRVVIEGVTETNSPFYGSSIFTDASGRFVHASIEVFDNFIPATFIVTDTSGRSVTETVADCTGT